MTTPDNVSGQESQEVVSSPLTPQMSQLLTAKMKESQYISTSNMGTYEDACAVAMNRASDRMLKRGQVIDSGEINSIKNTVLSLYSAKKQNTDIGVVNELRSIEGKLAEDPEPLFSPDDPDDIKMKKLEYNIVGSHTFKGATLRGEIAIADANKGYETKFYAIQDKYVELGEDGDIDEMNKEIDALGPDPKDNREFQLRTMLQSYSMSKAVRSLATDGSISNAIEDINKELAQIEEAKKASEQSRR